MLGQYEESIEWFDKALIIESKHVGSLSGKGMNYFWFNCIGEALLMLSEYEKAIEWYD